MEDDIKIQKWHKIILVEGLYLLLDDSDWKGVTDLLDEKWFVEIDLDLAMKRTQQRHMKVHFDIMFFQTKEMNDHFLTPINTTISHVMINLTFCL